jgi:hypothetical protein
MKKNMFISSNYIETATLFKRGEISNLTWEKEFDSHGNMTIKKYDSNEHYEVKLTFYNGVQTRYRYDKCEMDYVFDLKIQSQFFK